MKVGSLVWFTNALLGPGRRLAIVTTIHKGAHRRRDIANLKTADGEKWVEMVADLELAT